MRRLALVVLSVALLTTASAAQQRRTATRSVPPRPAPALTGKIWGMTFADYSYLFQNPLKSADGTNGFSFRRIYLGYDQDLSQQFSTRILVEANQGDTTLAGPMNFFIKNAYIEWKNLVPLSSIYFGLSPNATVATSERMWGYRSLEKVIVDRLGFANAADMGVALQGRFDRSGQAGYALMIANGNGTRNETNKIKRYTGSVTFEPAGGTVIDLSGDMELRPNDRYHAYGKLLAAYESPLTSIGAEAFYAVERHEIIKTGDVNPFGVSVFNWAQLGPQVRSVIRVDYYDPDLNVSNAGTRQVYGILGIDYMPLKEVHVIPNVLYTHLLNKVSSAASITDVITGRLTFAYAFSNPIP